MTTSAHDSILDEIREACELDMNKGVPARLDRLLHMGWCEPSALLVALDTLSSAEDESLAVGFCQLPFEVRLPDKWLKLDDGMPIDPIIRFIPLSALSEQRTIRTSVLISMPVTGFEGESFSHYAQIIQDKLSGKYSGIPFCDIVVCKSPVRKRPIKVKEYEKRIFDQIHISTQRILGSFLAIYSVACRDPSVSISPDLESFFLMVPGGRLLSYSGHRAESAPTRASRIKHDSDKNLNLLRRYLASKRKPSIYEQYLLEAARQSETGSPELAVVETVMILEWFVNSMILEHIGKPIEQAFRGQPRLRDLVLEELSLKLPTDRETEKKKKGPANELPEREHPRRGPRLLDKFNRYLKTINVDLASRSELWNELGKLISLRNFIVHRHSLSTLR